MIFTQQSKLSGKKSEWDLINWFYKINNDLNSYMIRYFKMRFSLNIVIYFIFKTKGLKKILL